MTTATAYADQLAAHLRDARSFHDGVPCDALDPCAVCAAGRREFQRMMIPTQRSKENR